jgi:two-component sensor histidine kinase
MKNILFLVLFLIIQSAVFSQTKFDNQYNSYWNKADQCWDKGDSNSVKEYLTIMNKLYKITKENKKDSLQAYVLYQWGNANALLNKKYDTQFDEAIQIAKKNNFFKMLTMIYNDYGQRKTQQRQFDTSINFYQEAIKYAKLDNNKKIIITTYLAIGQIFLIKKEDKNANKYFKEALFYASKIKKGDPLLVVYPSIFCCLSRSVSDLKIAEIYLQKADSVIKKVPDSLLNYKVFLKTQCLVDLKFNLHQKTIKDANFMLAFAKKNADEDLELMAYELLIKSYQKIKNYPKAKEYLDLFDHFEVVKDRLTKNRNLNRERGEIYFNTGDYKRAYYYLNTEIKVLDSTSEAKSKDALAEFSVKYQVEKSKTEIEKSKNKIAQQNFFIQLLIVVVFMSLITLSVFIWSLRKSRKLNKLLNIQKDNITKSLVLKEILLKEIHHRVKNNLQLIISILNIQEKRNNYKNVSDFLKNVETRISSMAIIHQTIYLSEEVLEKINFQLYTEDLVNSIVQTFDKDKNKVKVNINTNRIVLNLSTAMPLGLIVNELVTNALKHAFPDNRKGIITITIVKEQINQFKLIVEDNGIGFNMDNTKTKSFGLELINLLATQLKGNFTFENLNTTKFTITFHEINN